MKHKIFPPITVLVLLGAALASNASATSCSSCALVEARCLSDGLPAWHCALARAKCEETCTTVKSTGLTSLRFSFENAAIHAVLPGAGEVEVVVEGRTVVCEHNLAPLCAALEPGDVVTVAGDLPALDADDQRLHADVLAVKLAAEVLPDPLPVDRD